MSLVTRECRSAKPGWARAAMYARVEALEFAQPRNQDKAVSIEAAKLPTMLVDRVRGLPDQHGDDVQHALHIHSSHALV